MPKTIILLSDGTGNSSGKLFKTNVWRLYQALDLSGDNTVKPKQIAYYDDGVGTSSFKPFAFLGGAFGWGLKRNVIDLYTFLCWNYEPEDQIYCFGFSRGAFTIRVLTGLIHSQGLIQARSQVQLRKLATHAFRTYRREHYKTTLGLERSGRALRDGTVNIMNKICGDDSSHFRSERERPRITFVGLWDTVAAYGLPMDELTRAWNAVFPLSNPNRNLNDTIDRACHALALDDERNSFHPVMWNEQSLAAQNGHARQIQEERLSQVWFAGAHSNVGGGYPDDGLAYVSLDWMMTEAERPIKGKEGKPGKPDKPGLLFNKDQRNRVRTSVNPFGKIYDARHGFGGAYRYLPRKLSTLTNNHDDKNNPVIIDRIKVHESVMRRIKDGVDGYAPFALPASYSVVTTHGDIVDQTTPPTAHSDLIEDQTQAISRSNRQEQVWNLVWWKRIAYFSSVIIAAALIAFPLYRPATSVCEGKLCALSPFVSGIGMFLPSFLGSWIDAYTTHPGTFSILLGILTVLISTGGHLQDRIKDQMRSLWAAFRGQDSSCTSTNDLPNDIVFRLRTHPVYQRYFKVMKQYVLPTVFGLIAVIVIAQGAARGLFAIMNSGGLVCSATETAKILEGTSDEKTFSPKSICWASGIQLQEGKRYELTIKINNPEEWKDLDINTGVGGFSWSKMSPPMYTALLLRRHIGKPWFKPIARVGETGNDEYPLDPADQSMPDQKTMKLVAEITARRDGELFLFVNDAILPLPNDWQSFYKNNEGKATITVELKKRTPST